MCHSHKPRSSGRWAARAVHYGFRIPHACVATNGHPAAVLSVSRSVPDRCRFAMPARWLGEAPDDSRPVQAPQAWAVVSARLCGLLGLRGLGHRFFYDHRHGFRQRLAFSHLDWRGQWLTFGHLNGRGRRQALDCSFSSALRQGDCSRRLPCNSLDTRCQNLLVGLGDQQTSRALRRFFPQESRVESYQLGFIDACSSGELGEVHRMVKLNHIEIRRVGDRGELYTVGARVAYQQRQREQTRYVILGFLRQVQVPVIDRQATASVGFDRSTDGALASVITLRGPAASHYRIAHAGGSGNPSPHCWTPPRPDARRRWRSETG